MREYKTHEQYENENEYFNHGESKLVNINEIGINEEILSPIMDGKNYIGERFFVRDYNLGISNEEFTEDYY